MKTSFNVLIYKNGKVEHYDVLPYFRDSWKEKYNKKDKDAIKATKYNAKRKEMFKHWVRSRSCYMFWARCEWEMLLGSWPYGSKRINDQVKEFISEGLNLDNYRDRIVFDNIITTDMQKIDVHQQIEMNIDIIVDILYNELKLNK